MTAVSAAAAAAAAASSATAAVPFWVDICGRLAPIASIFVFMAPFPTMRQIAKDKSVGNLPLLPYTSMLVSATLWSTYGLLKHDANIYMANGVGLVLGAYYFWKFTKFAPKMSPTLPGSVKQHVNFILAMTLLTALTATVSPFPYPSPTAIIGKGGVVFCILMFASPLAAMQSVLQTKSAKSIPLPFTIASFLNCAFWVVYGVFQMNDVNIYVPNLLGLLFCVIQIALKFIYGNGPAGASLASGSSKAKSDIELPM